MLVKITTAVAKAVTEGGSSDPTHCAYVESDLIHQCTKCFLKRKYCKQSLK